MCVVVAGWRYTLAVTWVREKETPTAVLDRLWDQVKLGGIACKRVLLDRYYFTVPVMKWLQKRDLPHIIPAVMRGRPPKRGKKAKGLRSAKAWKAGSHAYTHRAGKESVDFRLVITYRSHRHRRTKKRASKKMFFATWKVRLSPAEVREMYRRRFGIETSYRQLNQSRSRTSSRDPLYRFLLVGLSLFLRNLWQWIVSSANRPRRRATKSDPRVARSKPTRYHDVLDAFSEYLQRLTQTQYSPIPIS